MAVYPSETVSLIIFFPEGGMLQIQFIQIFHKMCESIMSRIIQEHPVLFSFFVPFAELSDFISHEIQFFARVCVHVHIQGTRLREFVFIITAHFLHDGCLAVNDFIMREWEQETGIIIIHHRECEFVVIFRTVFRRSAEIIECIIHPSHIPFVIEAKTSLIDRIGHLRERGGIFGGEND